MKTTIKSDWFSAEEKNRKKQKNDKTYKMAKTFKLKPYEK